MRQLGQQFGGPNAGIDDAAAGIEDRPFGLGDHLNRLRDQRRVALDRGPVGLVGNVLGADIGPARELNVLRQVDDDRTGTTGMRDVEGLVHHACQVVDVAHQVVVLGAGPRDADGVGLLERVVADQVGSDLAGETDDRNAVHERVGKACDRVGGTWPRGHQ